VEILKKAQKILEKHPLCNRCLGRQFALLGYNLENQTRGETIKLLLTMKAHEKILANNKAGVTALKTLATNGAFPMAMQILQMRKIPVGKARPCYLCEEKTTDISKLAEKSVKLLSDYEFSTFLVGIKLLAEIKEREDEFKAEFGLNLGEDMRNDFSRVIGREISKLTGKEVEFNKPDISILVNPFNQQVTLQINPLYIAGKYKKLVRGVSQSRWLCRECKGKGCKKCNWTGKTYAESVEEFVAAPTLEMTQGMTAEFHGAGREDVDARMLGKGRPFIIEVKQPKKRFIDLKMLEETINTRAAGKVEVHELRFADKNLIRHLKKGEAIEKTYRVTVEFGRNVSDDELTSLEKSLHGILVRQQTPQRVLHRRSDRMREKYIYEAKVKRLSPNRAQLKVRCQGGLYVKELVTGDDGRTKPSVAEILGTKATPSQLDVLEVIERKQK
jgi:tRNA pseudouridine synthase 10